MKMRTFVTLMLTVLLTAPALRAEIVLPAVIGSGMVLQRDMEVPVWGKAAGGETVTVEFADQAVTTRADAEGRWMAKLAPMAASHAPRSMTIRGGNTIVLDNILVGEVWICSGQSNMEWPLEKAHNAALELAAAKYPEMRLFAVDKQTAETPRFDSAGRWEPTSPESAAPFSAVGYFFGRSLHQVLEVPVGLIHTSWGGTPAEAWTRIEALTADEVTAPLPARWEEQMKDYPERLARWEKAYAEWEASGKPTGHHTDKGITAEAADCPAPDFDDSGWELIRLPALMDDDYDGAVWYRKAIDIPANWAGRELQLKLGTIDDFDTAWFNGTQVGRTCREGAHTVSRVYTVPADQVSAGRAVVAVRVFDRYSGGGFTGSPNEMRLDCKAAGEGINLSGEWRWWIEQRLPLASGSSGGPRKPAGNNSPNRPGNLANGMLGPVVPFGVRGAVWYQGESNGSRAQEYRTLLPLMIRDWWAWWDQGPFPFGVVQIANWRSVNPDPADDGWAHLRDAQLHTAKTMPEVGLAVTIDIGEADDIHPRNKQEVGARLARWALAEVYAFPIVGSGPIYESFEVKDGSMLCTFSNVADGLEVREGGELQEFILSGSDRVWHWAHAEIVGSDRVRVWSDKVPEPVAVRYAWANNPARPNLVNSEDLPASPFRTDDWEQRF